MTDKLLMQPASQQSVEMWNIVHLCGCCGYQAQRWKITEWLSSWFMNRTTGIQVNLSIGPSRTFLEDLPQFSVLSTLLYTIYIIDLLVEFKDDAYVIACSASNKYVVISSLQPEVDNVVAWSARLTMNAFMCVMAFFSLDCAEAAWQPNITIAIKLMFCNTLLIFFDAPDEERLEQHSTSSS